MTNHLDKPIKIAVVGDIHDYWEADDGLTLERLGVDLVLFVGDFGNESVEVVRQIASLNVPKAVILGNHDAWYTASEWGRKRCPYDRNKEDRVQEQLNLLGEIHVGYDKLDFPAFNLTVVGSRPFSWGGNVWKNAGFYQKLYGVNNFVESTQRIVSAVQRAAYETVIFLAHSGPVGLGDRAEDPCGKDWEPVGGDYGDPDFAAAIAQTRQLGKSVPLVAFGHMHHQLRHSKQPRVPVVVSPEGTIYLNAANVPRILQTEAGRQRNFSLLTLHAGLVCEVSLVWVGEDFTVTAEEVLYQRSGQLMQPVLNQ